MRVTTLFVVKRMSSMEERSPKEHSLQEPQTRCDKDSADLFHFKRHWVTHGPRDIGQDLTDDGQVLSDGVRVRQTGGLPSKPSKWLHPPSDRQQQQGSGGTHPRVLGLGGSSSVQRCRTGR